MGARTFYSHAQAAMLLGVDDKTLNDWLRKAPEIQFQPSAADGRVKVISRTKLARLASLHQKTLPDNEEEILEADTRHAKSPAALTLKVEEMEQRLELLGNIFQQTVGELQGHIGELKGRLDELEQSPGRPLFPERPERERLPQAPVQRPPRIVASTITRRERQSADNPTEDLCSVREFCRLHNTTRDWIEPRIADGILQAERRPYGQHQQRLFTPAQQDAAVRWLDENFTGVKHQCPLCPHERQEEPDESRQAQA